MLAFTFHKYSSSLPFDITLQSVGTVSTKEIGELLSLSH